MTDVRVYRGHTRTQTDCGPDFCRECSEAISEWVPWPCSVGVTSPAVKGVRVYRTRPRLDPLNVAVWLGLVPGVAATFVVATLYMARGIA